jgi:hypothetical protein
LWMERAPVSNRNYGGSGGAPARRPFGCWHTLEGGPGWWKTDRGHALSRAGRGEAAAGVPPTVGGVGRRPGRRWRRARPGADRIWNMAVAMEDLESGGGSGGSSSSPSVISIARFSHLLPHFGPPLHLRCRPGRPLALDRAIPCSRARFFTIKYMDLPKQVGVALFLSIFWSFKEQRS